MHVSEWDELMSMCMCMSVSRNFYLINFNVISLTNARNAQSVLRALEQHFKDWVQTFSFIPFSVRFSLMLWHSPKHFIFHYYFFCFDFSVCSTWLKWFLFLISIFLFLILFTLSFLFLSFCCYFYVFITILLDKSR